jgi:hypothetical protein
MLRTFAACFKKYQLKNQVILYDAVGTLAEAVGPALNNKTNVDIIMLVLASKWEALGDDDRDIFPLLEVLLKLWDITYTCSVSALLASLSDLDSHPLHNRYMHEVCT